MRHKHCGANEKGANWQGLRTDFENGLLCLSKFKLTARAKMQLAGMVPQTVEINDPVTKMGVSAGTTRALRMMSREGTIEGRNSCRTRCTSDA